MEEHVNADLHNHGPEEWIDNNLWDAERLANLARGRKLDVLGIVEMGPIDNRFEILKKDRKGLEVGTNQIYVPEYKVILTRVLEIRTWKDSYDDWTKNNSSQGHILVVNARERIKEGTLESVLEKANKQGAVVIADHPYSGGHPASIGILKANGEEKIKGYIDQGLIHGVEYNGQMDSLDPLRLFTGWNANEKAIKFAEETNLPLIASTDAHSERENIANASFTTFGINDQISKEDYMEEIAMTIKGKKGKIYPHCKSAPSFAQSKHFYRILIRPKLERAFSFSR